MEPVERELLEREVDALLRDLAEERFRIAAGLEPEPALSAVYAAHGVAAHKETVARLRAAGQPELAGRVAALRAERVAAEDEEAWRAAEARAVAEGPDGTHPVRELLQPHRTPSPARGSCRVADQWCGHRSDVYL